MDDMHIVSMTVNGTPVSQPVSSRLLLCDFIRDDLRLVATHIGCGEGACGACTVLVDGQPSRSCTLLAVQMEGASIVTVEGLNRSDGLNTIQSAFQEHHALQCGFCTPGLLATVHWMVESKLPPDEHIIIGCLSGHLCRCTGYVNILKAVRSLLAPNGIP